MDHAVECPHCGECGESFDVNFWIDYNYIPVKREVELNGKN